MKFRSHRHENGLVIRFCIVYKYLFIFGSKLTGWDPPVKNYMKERILQDMVQMAICTYLNNYALQK